MWTKAPALTPAPHDTLHYHSNTAGHGAGLPDLSTELSGLYFQTDYHQGVAFGPKSLSSAEKDPTKLKWKIHITKIHTTSIICTCYLWNEWYNDWYGTSHSVSIEQWYNYQLLVVATTTTECLACTWLSWVFCKHIKSSDNYLEFDYSERWEFYDKNQTLWKLINKESSHNYHVTKLGFKPKF